MGVVVIDRIFVYPLTGRYRPNGCTVDPPCHQSNGIWFVEAKLLCNIFVLISRHIVLFLEIFFAMKAFSHNQFLRFRILNNLIY